MAMASQELPPLKRAALMMHRSGFGPDKIKEALGVKSRG